MSVPKEKEVSTHWWIRVTAPHEFLKEKYKAMTCWPDHATSAVAYHMGSKGDGKPHMHVALSIAKGIQRQAMRVRIKSLFGVKGNDYIVDVWDKSLKCYSYLYHEGEDAGQVDMSNAKLSDEEVNHINVLREVYRDIVTVAKGKSSFKCVQDTLEAIESSASGPWTARQIVEYIYRGVKAGKWHPPKAHQMTQYVEEIMLNQGTVEDGEDAVQRLTNKFMAHFDRY